MKKIYFINFVLYLCIVLKPVSFYGQNQSNLESYYKWYDSVIGVGNTGIYNGTEYEKKYRALGESQEFYFTSQFLKGDIVYDAQPYFNIEMKYDVFDDEVIVKLPNQYGGSIVIKLIKEKINNFNLRNNQFVRIDISEKVSISEMNSSFYQVLYQGNSIKLYKKHRKRRIERSDKDFIYNIFKESNESYIFYNKNYHKVKSKGDFLKLFPEQKKRINTFYKTNKTLRNLNDNKFIIELSKLIESTITPNEASNL